ncbi:MULTISPECIES: cell division protein FtsZ [Bifidobacterium]|uniref:Cell division protein FtsZ n=1 Tax=Bifidobacterium tibiigranuli TaxID=2172043 RepID=A0A5N6S246_9BIFI|nr:cell division protein FtsZ [Bifidobacterium tibiigranuli]KAE8128486.1 cell division protein FtsZ [Bifidobacterium tibiigranuli]KAE8128682.1 cell division protein FtsZ [Bifidobacterium tibiigranuli]MCH3974873.1 cell division protein FtsZ [Bifidobacterium tibiigranuli]MCH4190522.1 cell division protein FtsZ [Bifidobacterium tibiigranuli]MCH4202633.1 cell division protein FtsZ [Bifidobacterium tibiigranuli]
MSEIAQTDNFNDKTNIKVVGVGGAGGNAVNRMIAEGLQNVEFVAVNTDAKDLLRSDADVKISLNDASSRGLGAGADPEKGAKAAQDHQSDIEESLKGADMVFVTCGEGGGTGTGASPIVARAAHQQGALTIAVVTRPFSFEGPQRAASAKMGIENLRNEVDALIVIPNDRLLELSDRTIGIVDAFKTADTALLAGVQGITDLITMNSYIHVDFQDISSILRGSGTALFGIGSARGEDRAAQAAEIAISSPLLEESVEGAHGALINIAGPTDLKLQEASAATELVRKAIHPEAQIIWGLALDDAYGDEVRVTVIAAGFDANSKKTETSAAVPLGGQSAAQAAQPASSAQPRESAQVPPLVQSRTPDFTPGNGDAASQSFDDTTSNGPVPDDTTSDDGFSANDPGDLDIPDFLR